MPTILQMLGWRLFFYANEGCEPMHVHARKGEMECKFWLLPDEYEIRTAFARGLGPRDLREIRKLIFDHFDYIAERWQTFQQERENG